MNLFVMQLASRIANAVCKIIEILHIRHKLHPSIIDAYQSTGSVANIRKAINDIRKSILCV